MTLFEGFPANTFGLEFFLFWSEDVIKTTEHFLFKTAPLRWDSWVAKKNVKEICSQELKTGLLKKKTKDRAVYEVLRTAVAVI